jgi:hypothetical protein
VGRDCIHIITIILQDLPENPNQLLSLAEPALGRNFYREFSLLKKYSIQDRLEGIERDRIRGIHEIKDE